MEKLKLSRNLWILAGICFLIAFTFSIGDNKSLSLLLLQGVTAILCFVNAFLNHININKNNNS